MRSGNRHRRGRTFDQQDLVAADTEVAVGNAAALLG